MKNQTSWVENPRATSMAKKTASLPYDAWAAAVGHTAPELRTAWEHLRRRGLAAVKNGKYTISPLALRRANRPVQRRLAAHLAGFSLTENSFIVRRAATRRGAPAS